MLAGEAALKSAPIVADLMAKELGWNEQEKSRQIESFAKEFQREYQVGDR